MSYKAPLPYGPKSALGKVHIRARVCIEQNIFHYILFNKGRGRIENDVAF